MSSPRKSKRTRTEKTNPSTLQQNIIQSRGCQYVSKRWIERATELIRSASKKEIESLNGWSPLVRAIIMCGASQSFRNSTAWDDALAELIDACQRQGISLDAGDQCVATAGMKERPLVLAAFHGIHTAVAQLLHLGASPDCMNGEGRTALHMSLVNPVSNHRLRDCDRATFQVLVASSCIATNLDVYRSSVPGSKLYIAGDEMVYGTPLVRSIQFLNDDSFRLLVDFGVFLTDRDFLILNQRKHLRRLSKMMSHYHGSIGQRIANCDIWSDAVDWSFPPTWKVAVRQCRFCALPECIFNEHVVPFLPRHWFYTPAQLAGECVPPRILASMGELDKRGYWKSSGHWLSSSKMDANSFNKDRRLAS